VEVFTLWEKRNTTNQNLTYGPVDSLDLRKMVTILMEKWLQFELNFEVCHVYSHYIVNSIKYPLFIQKVLPDSA
jgi:hypothetical protein